MSACLKKAASSTSYKIGLAGCGKMGSAMAKGWLSSGLAARMDILDPHDVPSDIAAHKNVAGFTDATAFMKKASDWDVLILAIKPQTMEEFCASVEKYLPENLPLFSIATGSSLLYFAKTFGEQQPVIRSMPNTPAAIGKGMTVACANGKISAKQKSMAENLLNTLGVTDWLQNESLFDAVTGLSGSGPAYVFYLIEAMAKAGTALGLEPEFAMKLARQTVIGSAALAEDESKTPASKLRENVTSPNGTTAAALSVLMGGQFQKIVSEAIAKAAARSKELSK